VGNLPVDGQPRARRWSAPFPSNREEHRGGKYGKDENAATHPYYDARYQTDCANRLVILIFSSLATRIGKVPFASAIVNFASKQ
jgi:hypothetical protein